MSKYVKPKFEETDLGDNPFLLSLKIKVNKIQTSDKYKVYGKDAGDDAIFELASFEYESTSYCKLFSDADRRVRMVSLKPRAKDLLLWLMYEIKPGKDWIWLNKVRYMEENEIGSINTYKEALKDLIKKGYLNKTVVADTYWINPHFFFNGNRIKSFPDNVSAK